MEAKRPLIQDGVKYELRVIKYGKYELECYIFDEHRNTPALFIKNSETGSYHLAGDFYSYEWNAKDIKEDLIPSIDEVIERNWGDEILGNNFTLMSVIIGPDKTYFTSNNNLSEGRKIAQQDERMQLDTSVFREISILWLKFLESLENQKSQT